MENILVYEYDEFDARLRHWVRSSHLATAEAIRRMGGRIISGSGRTVVHDAVSSEGIARRT
jgi:hypothetical protein